MEWKDFVEELKSRLDIVEVIGSYLTLQKVGKNYRALCPFHTEKTPSFYVNPEKGLYHCFGCGASGDVIKFVQEIEQISFMEAVSKLAERVGINPPTISKKSSRYGVYTQLHETFARYYREVLFSSRGEKALEYLTNVMDLSEKEVEDFELGYAPHGPDPDVEKLLEREGLDVEHAVRYGLLRRDGSDYKHRFAGRVIFPIRNESGRVVGFGGRILGNGYPKYLNSKDSRFFKKSGLLYLFHIAKEIAKKVGFIVVVEGYFDAIALHRAGIKNAVASLTAALTPTQLSKIASVAENLLLVFDADEAGINAVRRLVKGIIGRNLSVRVATLESGKDPDEVLREHGKEKLEEELSRAVPYERFLANVETRNLDLGSASGKEAYLRRAARWYGLLKHSNPDRARGFLEAVSGLVEWSPEEVEGFWNRRDGGPKSTKDVGEVDLRRERKKDVEDFLVKLYVVSHSLRKEVMEVLERYQEVLSDFGRAFYRSVREQRDFNLNFLVSKLSKDMVDRLFDDLDVEVAHGKEREILRDCERELERRKLKAEIDRLDEKLESPSLSAQERNALLSKRIRLSKLLKGKG